MDKIILVIGIIGIIALIILLLFKGIILLIRKNNIYQIWKENEEQYRHILENVPDYVWVFNVTKNKFIYASSSSRLFRGYTFKELKNQTMEELVTPEFLENTINKVREYSEKLKENPGTLQMYVDEIKQPCKNGQIIWVEYTAKFAYNSRNEIEMIGVSRHIDERKKREKEIEYFSFYDQLTGIYNRHFFDKIIEKEMEHSDSNNIPLSMAMIDLDFFKRVNDTWGHSVGDEVLKLMVGIIKTVIRDSDKMFRFGGEEFVILMPKVSGEEAVVLSERIRSKIEKSDFPLVVRQTISIGVAQRLKTESFKHWYKRVDTALYKAKNFGRNRIVKSDEKETFPSSVIRLEWRKEWESGNQVIDQQHQRMSELGNALLELTLGGKDYEEIMKRLTELLKYIDYHFKHEEEILKELKYPEYENHKKIHDRLLSKAACLQEDYKRGEVKPSVFFSFIVDDVIFGHLENEDSKFFMYVKEEKDINVKD